MEVFKDYAKYYNLFYQNKLYDKEVNDVLSLLYQFGNYKEKVATILDLGCGTGRHAAEFVRKGYHVHGIDLSESMIDIAKEKNKDCKGLSFEVADIRKFSSNTSIYDMCVSLFHVMSYQNTNSDVMSALRTANRTLKLGGLFIFDFWYGVGVFNDPPVVRVKNVENSQFEAIRIATPNMHYTKNICDVNYHVIITDKSTGDTYKLTEKHCMRYFFKPEIELMLSRCGFDLLGFVSCDKLEEPDGNTWTAYAIAKKIVEVKE